MNTEDIKPFRNDLEKPVEGSKKEETQPIDQPKQGWFFPNTGEGTPFGVEAKTYEEALEANRRHLEQTKKEKH